MSASQELTDFGLLDLAETVLAGAGYEIQRSRVGLESVLLVENDENVALIAAPVTLDHLFEMEPEVSRVLSERLVAGPPNRKRWDAFVVFLCAQSASSEQTEPISDLVNNLRFARRLVRIAVEPTKAAVSRSLRPLLPLPAASISQLEDPLRELQRTLVRDGLDPALVETALQDFEVLAPPVADDLAEDDLGATVDPDEAV